MKQLIRLPRVRETVGLSRSEIYRLIGLGRFPRPVRLGERAVAWDMDEIQRFISERIEAREARVA